MSDQKTETQEPTMEEILASIRRIISEEDQGKAETSEDEAAAEDLPDQDQDGADDDDVLELTEKVEDSVDTEDNTDVKEPDGAEEPVAAEEAPETTEADDLVLEDEETPEPESVDDTDAEPEEPESAPVPTEAGDLVSAVTAATATATFGELSKALDQEPETTGNIALGPGTTLEDLVKEMVRPMLKDWLDQNLPTLVEHLVRKEIQRMVSRADDS
jgi:cell pole-organizing protein PopZ